ncbi:bifunctional 2-C-methyl-D-erythritol 4-phosphate cytidylyltransferase/2-C-methyl-D-erythritol 2,4-cyclodiphosphate synthase [Sphingomonas sp. gentR]|jgi:2-C-methyl-D-erythritol 4-phosphate cytidylyltransferase/2-C-methyl-D-erythritol 2,4-cyclodiphosphate synthase|uniref:bifunctional 2-C-methyl-D-erythritol 4-phosphate cytidylyltransferase/2-C-methyl-D-erythritol 2,4-cyclodiphosphate synthase n=1 Tax=unclassified Sphingomonas TaxID=196159 RepID=UPI000972A909|nr:bifunctional 2-C-methyl-D-erythritol 4-phosphate cytidylyltransferase/2-C-methyl-D-erythritol 2,4-cyclodiphosphate synthase [Sphingomonas sp. LK11]APX66323.1 2-C-methyl-D-erythritol 4-phosphate cytidylyltransferase [Sphingomonas sp. LK11]
MSQDGKIAALIVAAGGGSRMGGGVPKQFRDLGGRPMLSWSHAAFTSHPAVDIVLTMVAEEQIDHARSLLPGAWVEAGGASRRESVARGLRHLALAGVTQVLIHDAARPFLSVDVIDRVLAGLGSADGAMPVLPVADTLARSLDDALGETVPREGVVRVQTPQAFHLQAVIAAHAAWPAEAEATDDAQMVRRLGGRVALVQGDAMLEKITYPDDMTGADMRLTWETRTAMGYDVHRLEDGEELWLGGVLIPHHQGLSGHSDADVALHALTDALLGTIAAGDIGTHFPPSDPQWKGAESGQFLAHAAKLIADKGGRIDFVDLTIICEAPKIGPHRAAMVERIAGLLNIDQSRVSLKATTTERLGFTGRGEGIATQAVATVRLPGGAAA